MPRVAGLNPNLLCEGQIRKHASSVSTTSRLEDVQSGSGLVVDGGCEMTVCASAEQMALTYAKTVPPPAGVNGTHWQEVDPLRPTDAKSGGRRHTQKQRPRPSPTLTLHMLHSQGTHLATEARGSPTEAGTSTRPPGDRRRRRPPAPRP